MKINNSALCVTIDIYHEQQKITISNAFSTSLVQISHAKLQKIFEIRYGNYSPEHPPYSLAPSNKKRSFLSRSGSVNSASTGGERVKERVTVFGSAARPNQLWKRPHSYNIHKAVTSYHCHAYI